MADRQTTLIDVMLRFVFFASILTCPVTAQKHYEEREIRIPWTMAGPQGLDALLVYADLPGKHPLAIITHGTSTKPEARAETTPWSFLPQAVWFARRGWVALVVVRRGHGKSGGRAEFQIFRCRDGNYHEVGEESAEDLRKAIEYGSVLPQVDASHIICLGVSTGGFATVALTADAPSGLVAGINFAGGDGANGDHQVCNADALVGAFHGFGKVSRTPMLWIYAENDKYFWPELARQFEAAFRRGGGQDQFVQAPAIGSNGHSLFLHVSAWSSIVDQFLNEQRLTFLAEPLPAPAAEEPAPAGLSEVGQRAFHAYLTLGIHKAFAVSESAFGLAVAQITTEEAKRKALDHCRHSAPKGDKCRIVSVDNQPADVDGN